MAQSNGSRLYIRYDDVNLAHYEGLRIRLSEDYSDYWVMGRISFGLSTPLPLAVVGPTALAKIPAGGGVNPLHAHYVNTKTPYLVNVGSASDFWVNPDNSLTVSALKVVATPPLTQKYSLFTVDQGLKLSPNTSTDYGFLTDLVRSGSGITLDRSFTPNRYVVAFNTNNPLQATNLMDWGIASIDATNLNTVLWSQTWTYAPPYQYEEMRDLKILTGNGGASRYAVCGLRRNTTTNLNGGLVTVIDNAGALVWQYAYNPPAGSGLSLEFNGITERVQVGNPHLVLSGTIYSTNPNIPTSVAYVGVDANNGTLLWAKRYSLTNGITVEGFRNCELLSKNNAIAGTVTHPDGHTSGTLIELLDPAHSGINGCDSLVVWWKYYETMDAAKVNVVNTSLVDLVPRLNGDIHDLAAVGTAQATHSNQLIRDVLWIETGTSGGDFGRCFSGVFPWDSSGYHCFEHTALWTCDNLTLSSEDLKPEPGSKFEPKSTPMDSVSNSYAKNCDENLSGLPSLGNTSSPKQSEESDERAIGVFDQEFTPKAYPIPYLNGELTIELATPSNLPVEIALYDVNGAAQHKTFLASQKTLAYINCSHLPIGVYVLRLQSGTLSRIIKIPILPY